MKKRSDEEAYTRMNRRKRIDAYLKSLKHAQNPQNDEISIGGLTQSQDRFFPQADARFQRKKRPKRNPRGARERGGRFELPFTTVTTRDSAPCSVFVRRVGICGESGAICQIEDLLTNVFGASLSRSVLLSGLVSELNFRIGVPHLAWFLQMVFNMWWLLQLVLVLFEVCWFLDPYATTVSRLVDPGLSLASYRLPGAHPRFVWLSLCKPPVVMGL
ncbi:hypothetical protein HID58_001027 [Brassica napus]|uniref:Uncharacterized protein n=1 Tax=Brassica napus TaxID=3708 RepID=A0ABQ8EI82_BRANA|nr:hypothetical protein HID58_001027 [Brassica napus]